VGAQLYTQDFYRTVVEPKLAPDGIFVTQSGPAGVLSCSEVFSPINHTLNSVFPRVIPYVQHIPSYVDTWVRTTPLQGNSDGNLTTSHIASIKSDPQVRVPCFIWSCT
jgi:predicted membrane-bound spermidine synthase